MLNLISPDDQPFFYQFNQPGVFAFKLSNINGDQLDRDLYIQGSGSIVKPVSVFYIKD